MKTIAEWIEYAHEGKRGMSYEEWIAAIQRDALEAAAKVCDRMGAPSEHYSQCYLVGAQHCAQEIRALLPPPPGAQT